MPERTEGVNYVTLQGRGQRELYNGASAIFDSYMHLGISVFMRTICGKCVSNFLVTYADVEIDCPECIAAMKGATDRRASKKGAIA